MAKKVDKKKVNRMALLCKLKRSEQEVELLEPENRLQRQMIERRLDSAVQVACSFLRYVKWLLESLVSQYVGL